MQAYLFYRLQIFLCDFIILLQIPPCTQVSSHSQLFQCPPGKTARNISVVIQDECQRKIYVMVNLVDLSTCISDLRKELKKKNLAVYWTLLRSVDNFVIQYFKNLEGKMNGARLKLCWVKEAAVVHIIQDRIFFGYFCDQNNIYAFVLIMKKCGQDKTKHKLLCIQTIRHQGLLKTMGCINLPKIV